jgi:hypothetical protein
MAASAGLATLNPAQLLTAVKKKLGCFKQFGFVEHVMISWKFEKGQNLIYTEFSI